MEKNGRKLVKLLKIEINEIKKNLKTTNEDLPKCICFSKVFLNFSLSKDIGMEIMKKIKKQKKDEKNLLNNIKETTNDKDLKNKEKNKETKKDEKEDNIDNEISIKKEEPPSKKYKVTNLGRNVTNLDENYSTDDEDEYKFIQLINESNDDYEKVVDSKTIKVFAKIVSLYW